MDTQWIDPIGFFAQHRPTSIVQTFQHLACLYIKYLQIFKSLETCYDCIVHPQKRADVLKVCYSLPETSGEKYSWLQVLELVIRRVIELKYALVKYNPPNPAVRRGPGKPERLFPWEYVNLDDILIDLKLPPETLEVPVPRYFKENSTAAQRVRDKIVSSYMKVRHGLEKIMLEEDDGMDSGVKMELASAIEVIQRNERGRQGKQRALLVKELREEEKRRRNYDAAAKLEMDPEIAAIGIQRLFRGFFSRARAAVAREEELVFIGMQPPKHGTAGELDLAAELATAYRKRKTEQADNQAAYEKALDDIKNVVREEEGPHMRAELRGERTDWVTNMIQTTKVIPDDLDGFYPDKFPDPPSEKKEAGAAAKGTGKGAKDEKKKGGKADKKGKKSKKSKKGADGGADEKPAELPLLQGRSEITTAMHGEIKIYEEDWADRDERENFAQRHDVELAKRAIREEVRLEIRDQVDEMLRMNLKKIKLQLTKTTPKGGGKGGKKSKKDKKKKGGKKGKKSKKKSGKKTKALPGDKISDLKNMTVEEMLAALVEARVINNYRDRHIQELVGDFNYLGTVQQHTEFQQSAWVPPNPSMAQLRAAVTEYCVLPLGSQEIKNKLQDRHNVKSIMLYGPTGAGKTMIAEAVANELGALFINISPDTLKGGSFVGKNGPSKLCHMIYSIAKDNALSPIVVYMDQCEQFFVGGGKKAKSSDKDGPSRFKKDLLTYKNAIAKEDRLIFIGTTSHPDKGDPKEFKAFFDKMLYMPIPDYPSRLMLWRKGILVQLAHSDGAAHCKVPDDFDVSTLAQVSEGFSAGAICLAVKKTLTRRRVERLGERPHNDTEFLNALAQAAAKHHRVSRSDHLLFRDFTCKITGLDDERRRIRDEKKGEAGGAPAKEEKKGKGKSKGKKGKAK